MKTPRDAIDEWIWRVATSTCVFASPKAALIAPLWPEIFVSFAQYQ